MELGNRVFTSFPLACLLGTLRYDRRGGGRRRRKGVKGDMVKFGNGGRAILQSALFLLLAR